MQQNTIPIETYAEKTKAVIVGINAKKKIPFMALKKHVVCTISISSFLAFATKFEKLVSQAYIFITLMPLIISFMILIRISVFLAVLLLK